MIPGEKLRQNIIDKGLSIKDCSTILDIHILDITDFFEKVFEESEYNELCEKLGLEYVVDYGISQKKLCQLNEVQNTCNQQQTIIAELETEKTKLAVDIINLRNLVRNKEVEITRLNEQIKKQFEKIEFHINTNIELENKISKRKSKQHKIN